MALKRKTPLVKRKVVAQRPKTETLVPVRVSIHRLVAELQACQLLPGEGSAEVAQVEIVEPKLGGRLDVMDHVLVVWYRPKLVARGQVATATRSRRGTGDREQEKRK